MPSKKGSNSTESEYSSRAPAVEHASQILLALAQAPQPGITFAEVSSAAGIHKNKGYSILQALRQFALIRRSPDSKAYTLGPDLIFLSSKVLSDLDLRRAVAPVLRGLALETNGAVFLRAHCG